MKKLVVCCDGTWNTADERTDGVLTPTNVLKFSNLVQRADDQKIYYHPGVGAEANLFKKAVGGMFGEGIDRNIKSAWKWLGENYEVGDKIYLIGFSRGAYTVRSLGGLIGYAGLPAVSGLLSKEIWARVDAGYEAFRNRQPSERSWSPQPAGWFAPGVEIEFLGVWDTVGALGIPEDAILSAWLNERWAFLNTQLGAHVKKARHALAIDERRASFTPTLWTDGNAPVYGNDQNPNERIVQVWFPGVHSDVGGGYAESGLSDGALRWMVDHAANAGLTFNQLGLSQIAPKSQGELHESWQGPFRALKTRPRTFPSIEPQPSGCIHQSALDRSINPPISNAPYHDTRLLNPGESTTVEVFAAQWWNATNIYLLPGKYRFAASGEWLDAKDPATPAGIDKTMPELGEVARLFGTITGQIEKGVQALTHNEAVSVWASRRHQNLPWFSLVGAVANNAGARIRQDVDDWSNREHQIIGIGDGIDGVAIAVGGYLYAYANDAWGFYDNNHGSVALTVTRVS